MRKNVFLLILVCLLILSGLALSQDETEFEAPDVEFTVAGEIGRALPRKIIYDTNYEQMAVVDAYNRLLLTNALDYQTKAILHERGEFIDFAFSNNGRWLAVLNGLTVELWDTQTTNLVATIDNPGVNSLSGPLTFSSADDLLLFYGVSPAPLALRRSENDVRTYPWLWHLEAAREETPSTFPNEAEYIRMSDYSNGFMLTPDNRLIGALPARLNVLDAYTLEALYEIPTERFERDPMYSWKSLGDDRVYVRDNAKNTLLQVDTARGVLIEFPLGIDLTSSDLALIGDVELGEAAQTIGGQNQRTTTALSNLFLGNRPDQTLRKCDDGARTITLIDLVIPSDGVRDDAQPLLFVYNEALELGCFLMPVNNSVQQMILSPDKDDLLVRLFENDEYIVRYKISTGQEISRFLPALRGIGRYSRLAKNRVLAYTTAGDVMVSDFQRIDVETRNVLAEDLRYARSFDRFYFSADSQKIITLAGSEWREWSIETGEILRREIFNVQGSIIATASDGSRFLSQELRENSRFTSDDDTTIMHVKDLNTGRDYSVTIRNLPNVRVSNVIANPDWTKFLVVYNSNAYGPHHPGNEIALYDANDGLKWVIAGDDLPPIYGRSYGWIDNDTLFVSGQGIESAMPKRVFGADYAPNGLPRCLVEAYPEQIDAMQMIWERLLYFVRGDRLAQIAIDICAPVPASFDQVRATLAITPTPSRSGTVGAAVGEVPQCLLDRYPADATNYEEIWRRLTSSVTLEERNQLAEMICEGIGEIAPTQEFDPSLNFTMIIDAETGLRATGSNQLPAQDNFNALQPIQLAFTKKYERPLGTAILSPDRDLVAASNLPGELIIYRMSSSYDEIVTVITATAASQLATANLVFPEPSPSPTFQIIGTYRPTLTPTPSQTALPPPQAGFTTSTSTSVCPAESLFPVSAPPSDYDASGRIYAVLSDGPLWAIEPENGIRLPDEEIPQCRRGIECQFSPDKSWILARTYDLIYVMRPDNSDQRVLWDLRTPNPPTPVPRDIYWTGKDTLEWQYNGDYLRDVLNVFPDPAPWRPTAAFNEIPGNFVSRQPGGPWAVFTTPYNTGSRNEFKYYLYNVDTRQVHWFAQGIYSLAWHPLGQSLFYYDEFDHLFQVEFPDAEAERRPNILGGVWSNDGRYTVSSTDSRSQPIEVYDSHTGERRTYCLPETGARFYQGPFLWSPDNRYVALQTFLPRDEAQEGVGQHLLILNIETGHVVDVTTGIYELVAWSQEPGTYGTGSVVTPTPFATVTPTATP